MYSEAHHIESLFWGNAGLLVLGELAEKEGDPHGEEDEEEARGVHNLCLWVFSHILQITLRMILGVFSSIMDRSHGW